MSKLYLETDIMHKMLFLISSMVSSSLSDTELANQMIERLGLI